MPPAAKGLLGDPSLLWDPFDCAGIYDCSLECFARVEKTLSRKHQSLAFRDIAMPSALVSGRLR